MIAPSLELAGGQSVQAARLIHGLSAERSVQVSFLRTDTAFRGPLRPFRSVRYARTLMRLPLYLVMLVVRIPRCDVLHVFSGSNWSFVLSPTPAILLGKLFRKKVVVNYHSGLVLEHLPRWRTAIRTLRWTDAIVVQSAFLERAFARVGLSTVVIPNHVDLAALPFRSRTPLRPLFLSTRALEPSYGVATVIRAFAIIKQQFADAELHIVGDGSSRAALERLVHELELPGVTFRGVFDPARAASIYDAADVLLNASTVDNMPLSLLEAFACGLPVVSSAAGGIPDVVRNEETGLLVSVDDPNALAAAAIRLLREPDLASRLTDAARSECAKYSWTATGPDWLHLYRRLVNGRCP